MLPRTLVFLLLPALLSFGEQLQPVQAKGSAIFVDANKTHAQLKRGQIFPSSKPLEQVKLS